ncbi:ECF transporter S component [candidate division KSB1 bacterium]
MEKPFIKDTTKSREMVTAAIFGALGVIFPVLFHLIGLGSVFLPMYLPIATMGFLVSFPIAVSTGIITPLFSAVVTGMPPFFPPVALVMCIELSVLAGSISLFYRRFKWNIWISLIGAIILSRTIYILILLLVIPLLMLPPEILTIAAVISSIPGIILMAAIVPFAVKTIENKLHL